jgi:hypothetical protein
VVWEFASGSFRKSSSVSTRQQTRALVDYCEADLCGGFVAVYFVPMERLSSAY